MRSRRSGTGSGRSRWLAALDDLASRSTSWSAGAGSIAEINLRATDVANLGLASARELPVVVVADIDRGGAFASLFGSLALLEPRDQRLVAGFVVNRFRGDPRLLEPGLAQLERLTGRPTLGVVPWLDAAAVDAEDSLSLAPAPPSRPPTGRDVLTVAAVRLPRTSNATDLDALAAEPGVEVRWTANRAEVRRRRPRRAARHARNRRRSRLAARARPRRRRPGPGPRRAAGARDLRRLPDARPDDHR